MQLNRRKDRDDAAPRVPCPCCGADALFSPANPYRPFCSERCRQMDLGAWASERFRVADPSPLQGSQDPESPSDLDAPNGPH